MFGSPVSDGLGLIKSFWTFYQAVDSILKVWVRPLVLGAVFVFLIRVFRSFDANSAAKTFWWLPSKEEFAEVKLIIVSQSVATFFIRCVGNVYDLNLVWILLAIYRCVLIRTACLYHSFRGIVLFTLGFQCAWVGGMALTGSKGAHLHCLGLCCMANLMFVACLAYFANTANVKWRNLIASVFMRLFMFTVAPFIYFDLAPITAIAVIYVCVYAVFLILAAVRWILSLLLRKHFERCLCLWFLERRIRPLLYFLHLMICLNVPDYIICKLVSAGATKVIGLTILKYMVKIMFFPWIVIVLPIYYLKIFSDRAQTYIVDEHKPYGKPIITILWRRSVWMYFQSSSRSEFIGLLNSLF